MLLYDAISRVAEAPAGAYAICADAIDEDAAAFYRDHQFQPLVSRPQSLFLPMKTAMALVSGTQAQDRGLFALGAGEIAEPPFEAGGSGAEVAGDGPAWFSSRGE